MGYVVYRIISQEYRDHRNYIIYLFHGYLLCGLYLGVIHGLRNTEKNSMELMLGIGFIRTSYFAMLM